MGSDNLDRPRELFVIVFCVALGGLMVFRALGPWVSMEIQIKKIEITGSAYLRTSPPLIVEHIASAHRALIRRHADKALAEIAAARKLDPSNPLFDYLRAAVVLHVRGGRWRGEKLMEGDKSSNADTARREPRSAEIISQPSEAERAAALKVVDAGNAKGTLRFCVIEIHWSTGRSSTLRFSRPWLWPARWQMTRQVPSSGSSVR